ncbi:TPA: hypothetical protein HA265_07800 [Candidatus Woesearchaeota archaeon]|nr:hypothetical protein [Candidatus Woesearchaeota archaeon]
MAAKARLTDKAAVKKVASVRLVETGLDLTKSKVPLAKGKKRVSARSL